MARARIASRNIYGSGSLCNKKFIRLLTARAPHEKKTGMVFPNLPFFSSFLAAEVSY
jgi:hypothetical protein